MTHDISLADPSVTTTNSGDSEAAREVHRIFEQTRQGLILESQSRNSAESPQTRRTSSKPLLRKSSSILSNVIRAQMSRDSVITRKSFKQHNGVSHNISDAERQKELQKALKERLERELREGIRASAGGYDSEAQVVNTLGSRIGYTTFRARSIPYNTQSVLADRDLTPREECEAIDFELAQEYRSFLAHVDNDSEHEGDIQIALTKPSGERKASDAMVSGHSIQRSASDSALDQSSSQLYRVASPDTEVDPDNELYKERLKLLSKNTQGVNDACKERPSEPHSFNAADESCEGLRASDDAEAQLSFSLAQRPHDSGISLRDLDPSEYSGSSGSGGDLGLPSWLKRAGSLINPSRFASTQSDPTPRLHVNNEPSVGEEHFGGVDGHGPSITPISNYPSRSEESTASPNSDVGRAMKRITIPPRPSRRSLSEATPSADLERTKRPSKEPAKSERRMSLNSFRRRLFSQTSPGSTRGQENIDEPLAKVQRVPSRRSKIVKQRSDPLQIRKKACDTKCFQASTDSFVAQELAAAKRIVPRPRASTMPRTSRFKEELDEDVTEMPANLGADNTGLSRDVKAKACMVRTFDGSDGSNVTFRMPDFGPKPAYGANNSADEAWGRALQMHKIDVASGYLEPSGFNRGRRSVSPSRLSVSHARMRQSPGASSGLSPAGSDWSEAPSHGWRPSLSRASHSAGYSSTRAKSRSSGLSTAQRRPTRAPTILEKKPEGTWARFPSHMRAKRNGPAGVDDRIISRDFATDLVIATPESGNHRRSLHKLSLKQRLKRDLIGFFDNNSYGHRSSVSAGGEVEYPELEVLPNLEMPFFLPDEEDGPSLEQHTSQASSSLNDQLTNTPVSTPFLEISSFNIPSIRRISTSVAPDVIIEYPEASDVDESALRPDITSSSARFSTYLHPTDAMRVRSDSMSLNTARSSSGEMVEKSSDKHDQVRNSEMELRIDVTNQEAAGQAAETDGCLDYNSSRRG